ncbi:MAG: right-handed parallel beta-helix repeat-containing protein [Pirellulales bacterium]
MRFLGGLAICLAVWMFGLAGAGGAVEYYVAPTGGSDMNNGSIGSPFATFTKAIGLSTAGDTIFARGGTYSLSTTVSISSSKSGTAANPIKLLAYPGETPILDFRGQPYSASNSGLKGISLNGSYWHIKGLTIQYAADNGMAIGGSNNVVEQVVARQNQDSGIQISGSSMPSNNLILNCDSYANFDFGSGGENADGFAVKFRGLGPGNVLSGVRAWSNADDGFDFWQAEHGISVINSWSFHNGIAAVFNDPEGYAGDSNGIKLGKDSGTHVLENMLIWGNDGNGVDINGNATESGGTVTPAVIPHGVQAFNITSAFNGNRNYRYDEDPTTTTPPSAHVIRNSISYSGTVTINPGNTVDHNTFAGPGGTPAGLGVSAADFVSTVDPVLTPGNYHPAGTGGDRSGVTIPIHATGPAVEPRLADGSLPFLDFLRLAPGSHLIDAGIDVGLPYNGLAPDLGRLETVPPGPTLPGDYNGDNVVDAVDYTVWRDNLNASVALPNDETPGTVDAGDYDVWKSHFGESLAGSGGQSASTVPEPAALILALAAAAIGLLARRR